MIRLFLAFLPLTPPPKKKRKKQNKHHPRTRNSSNCCCRSSKQATNQRCEDKLQINVPFATTTSATTSCVCVRAYVAAAASADSRSVTGEKASVENSIGNRYGNGLFREPIENRMGTKIGNMHRNGLFPEPKHWEQDWEQDFFVNQLRTEWGPRLGTGPGTDFFANQFRTALGTGPEIMAKKKGPVD